MRDIRFLLRPEYINSRALIIGIDNYKHVSPLSYAVSDAQEVKQVLEAELEFPAENTVYLTNKEATQKAILKEFIRLTDSSLALDERNICILCWSWTHPLRHARAKWGIWSRMTVTPMTTLH